MIKLISYNYTAIINIDNRDRYNRYQYPNILIIAMKSTDCTCLIPVKCLFLTLGWSPSTKVGRPFFAIPAFWKAIFSIVSPNKLKLNQKIRLKFHISRESIRRSSTWCPNTTQWSMLNMDSEQLWVCWVQTPPMSIG